MTGMRRGFTIHHNGPPARCIGRGHDRCIAYWAGVRSFHMNDQGWSDIAYSFGICPHGERFVGRGWDLRQFANGRDDVGPDDGGDAYWYTVLVFVGGDDSTGDNEHPTPAMVAATAALIDEGRRTGRCGRRVTPHNFWKRKPCPGPEFTELARRWDNADLAVPTPPLPEEPDMTPEQATKLDQIHDAVFGGKPNEIARQVWALRVDNFPTASGSAADYMRRLVRAVHDGAEAEEIASLVLASLTPQAIAAAVPEAQAAAVADELAARLLA